MKTFLKLLGVALVVATTNNFVWFALTYWIYLGTKSVISTSTLGGIFVLAMALSNIWFGGIVDRYKKKQAMLGSSVVTLIMFSLGFLLFKNTDPEVFNHVNSVGLWVFVLIMMGGVVMGGIYQIAVPTLVAILVPEDKRDKANGMFGTVMGIAFAITSVASGLMLAYAGLFWVLVVAVVNTMLAIVAISLIPIPEKKIVGVKDDPTTKIDIKGTIAAIKVVPGLFALIFFTTFNNFLGGVFMALMDAYGLTLVSVQVWGLLWGGLSFGFIVGGLFIAKFGLGKNPVATLFKVNMVLWTVCIFFTIQPSIVLLAIGMFIWLCLIPFAEASEQTIFQKVVPKERLGRVFGFAHSVEQAASPITAFLIGPLAQLVFIPFMTTGKGVDLIGDWFGVGEGRGIALVFTIAGIVGFAVTQMARRTSYYKLLSERYVKK